MGKNNLFSFNVTSKEVKTNMINIPEGYVNIPGFDGYMANKHGSIIRIYCNETKWKEVKGFVNNTEIQYESLFNCSKAMNINAGTIQEKIATGTLYKK